MYVCYKVYKAESKRDKLENLIMFFPVNNKTLVENVCESEIQTLGRLNLKLYKKYLKDKLWFDLTWEFPVNSLDSPVQQKAAPLLNPAGCCYSGPDLSD